ncbi:MAG: hypothetical protein ABJG47_08705 [Ekhidna sp.]
MEGKTILLVIIGTVGVMLMAFSVVFFILLYRRKVLENRLKIKYSKSFEEQLSKINNASNAISELKTSMDDLQDFLNTESERMLMNRKILKDLEDEKKKIEPIVNVQKETLANILDAYTLKNEKSNLKTKFWSFIIGVVSSGIATIITYLILGE